MTDQARDPDRDKGLYCKYQVKRTDGGTRKGRKHEKCDYFVLDLDHDRFARPALMAYIRACSSEYPILAKELTAKLAATGIRVPAPQDMTGAQVLDAFLYVPEHPLWKAILGLLEAHREQEVQLSKDPTLSDKETHMALGAVNAMDDFKNELMAQAVEARRRQAGEKGAG